MPTQATNTTVTITTTAIVQNWIVAPGVIASGGFLAFHVGATLLNYGSLFEGATVGAQFEAGSGRLYNEAGAHIAGATGVRFLDALSEVHNSGDIRGLLAQGIVIVGGGDGHVIDNSGYIYGLQGGVVVGSAGALNVSINNSGQIVSDNIAVHLVNAPDAAPVVVNTGTISGTAFSILAEGGDRLNVTNSGTLSGDVSGRTVDAADSVSNTGAIVGSVLLGSGNDSYSGSGTVSGTVFGEGGDDSLGGGTTADRLDGGAGADTLTGNDGNDVLTGGADADSLRGGLGNDSYNLADGSDAVTDTGGTDTITSTISRSLASHTAIEQLTLLGSSVINGAGNGLANVMTGNDAANVLSGAAGNDRINGGVGNDRLLGGLGRDTLTGGGNNDFFVFNTAPNTSTNRDVVTDFNRLQDTFQMENAVFTKLGAATLLNPAFFRAGAAALDGNDYIVYNRANGVLVYDSDGNLAGGAVQVAVLTNRPTLTFADFVVI